MNVNTMRNDTSERRKRKVINLISVSGKMSKLTATVKSDCVRCKKSNLADDEKSSQF